MNKRLLGILSILAAAAALPASDQFQLSLFQTEADNLYQTALGPPDGISSFSLAWDKSMGPFTLFADGDYAYLRKNAGLSYLAFGGGGEITSVPWGKERLCIFPSRPGGRSSGRTTSISITGPSVFRLR